MSGIAFAVLVLGALAGGFVSGLAGFGTALMALGIWLYVLPPSAAVPLVLICSIVAQTSTLHSIWRSIDFKLLWPFVLGGVAGHTIASDNCRDERHHYRRGYYDRDHHWHYYS